MDPRLRIAVDVSLAWYADMFALHGIPTVTEGELWRALGAPPPLHSTAKTLAPGVPEEAAVAAVAAYDVCSVADSFGDLDLAGHGFATLFDATWIHHPPLEPGPMPHAWSRVTDPEGLAAWTAVHGSPEVFPPAILDRPAFTLTARRDDSGDITAIAVVHDSSAGVGVSNVAAATGHTVAMAEVLELVAALHPGRPVTDYDRDEALDDALAAGFTALGPQRVWSRG